MIQVALIEDDKELSELLVELIKFVVIIVLKMPRKL